MNLDRRCRRIFCTVLVRFAGFCIAPVNHLCCNACAADRRACGSVVSSLAMRSLALQMDQIRLLGWRDAAQYACTVTICATKTCQLASKLDAAHSAARRCTASLRAAQAGMCTGNEQIVDLDHLTVNNSLLEPACNQLQASHAAGLCKTSPENTLPALPCLPQLMHWHSHDTGRRAQSVKSMLVMTKARFM